MPNKIALEIWKERLAFLQRAEAIASSAVERFALEKQIEEAKSKIAELTPANKPSDSRPRSDIPHNLPALQPFFGREEELAKIAGALDPENRTWGAVIDGPGGMGKTSLAIRASIAYTSEQFEKIVFVSLKSRELDDDGVRDLSGFLISGLAELFNELARELCRADIVKAIETDRPLLLLNALRATKTLLILDNLESLFKAERDTVFNLVKRLPSGCKAILTSRMRLGSGAEELILEKLSEDAAMATLADLSRYNPGLAKTSEAERLVLYRETGGKPLLLRWTAGQIGRGHCVTFTDAISYLRSCPKENNPLEFIFGDLIGDFSEVETRALCALTYFTLPAKVEHIAEVIGIGRANAEGEHATRMPLSLEEIDLALKSLANRSLVVPNEEFTTFTLVPLVADFLRKAKPQVIAESGARLETFVYALAVENGFRKYNQFPILDAAWPVLAAALPRCLAWENGRLQHVCEAFRYFFEFAGHWDEWLALTRDAEDRALAAGNIQCAGWQAHHIGVIHCLRGKSDDVFASADRAERHWQEKAGLSERASIVHLRGLGHELLMNYSAAVAAYSKAVELWRAITPESEDVVAGLNCLAVAERLSGDLDASNREYREALRIAQIVGYQEGIAYVTGNLAVLAGDRGDWLRAESLAREALSLAEKVGRAELVAVCCYRLARALSQQGRKDEGRPNAERAVEICARLGSPRLREAREVLGDCEG